MNSNLVPKASFTLFLLINTRCFWANNLGLATFPIAVILFIIFITLIFFSIYQLVTVIKERFTNQRHIFFAASTLTFLVLIALFPDGLVDYERFTEPDVFVAGINGAANCSTILKLKANKKFALRSMCFGTSETKGTYQFRGDTIFLHANSIGRNKRNYAFAVIGHSKLFEELGKEGITLYKNKADTRGRPLLISKNELRK